MKVVISMFSIQQGTLIFNYEGMIDKRTSTLFISALKDKLDVNGKGTFKGVLVSLKSARLSKDNTSFKELLNS